MKKIPHVILETANFHGGDAKQITQAIESFSRLNKNAASIEIKFHDYGFKEITT